jgi:hypothetical protein
MVRRRSGTPSSVPDGKETKRNAPDSRQGRKIFHGTTLICLFSQEETSHVIL